jgi:hypothetical protein
LKMSRSFDFKTIPPLDKGMEPELK